MNEVVKRLLQQATSYTWNGDGVTEELDEQKFAELIVKECYYLVDYENKQFIKSQFKEYFGVTK